MRPLYAVIVSFRGELRRITGQLLAKNTEKTAENTENLPLAESAPNSADLNDLISKYCKVGDNCAIENKGPRVLAEIFKSVGDGNSFIELSPEDSRIPQYRRLSGKTSELVGRFFCEPSVELAKLPLDRITVFPSPLNSFVGYSFAGRKGTTPPSWLRSTLPVTDKRTSQA